MTSAEAVCEPQGEATGTCSSSNRLLPADAVGAWLESCALELLAAVSAAQ